MKDKIEYSNGLIILSDHDELDISGKFSAVHLNSIEVEQLKRMLKNLHEKS